MNTKVNLCGKILKNPVITASGTFGFAHEYEDFMDVNRLGGVCSKGITLIPKDGNTGIRIHEVSSGIINSIGLENKGIQHFIDVELPKMRKYDIAVIANLGGNNIDQYVEGAKLLDNSDVDIIELNISCPNVKCGGMAFGIEEDTAREVVSKVRKVVKKPLMVKLSPNAKDIVKMAVAVEEAGADSISMVNTFNAMAIDIYKRRTVFDNITAGMSGKAIKPIALAMTYKVAKQVKIPIVAMGGITNYEDAIEFIMAGATAIQVGSANFIKPDITIDIIEGIENFMKEQNIEDLNQIRGII